MYESNSSFLSYGIFCSLDILQNDASVRRITTINKLCLQSNVINYWYYTILETLYCGVAERMVCKVYKRFSSKLYSKRVSHMGSLFSHVLAEMEDTFFLPEYFLKIFKR